MTRRKRIPGFTVAACADSDEEVALLNAHVKERGWSDSGGAYRLSDADRTCVGRAAQTG